MSTHLIKTSCSNLLKKRSKLKLQTWYLHTCAFVLAFDASGHVSTFTMLTLTETTEEASFGFQA